MTREVREEVGVCLQTDAKYLGRIDDRRVDHRTGKVCRGMPWCSTIAKMEPKRVGLEHMMDSTGQRWQTFSLELVQETCSWSRSWSQFQDGLWHKPEVRPLDRAGCFIIIPQIASGRNDKHDQSA